MRKGLNINLFTNADNIRGVELFSGDSGRKWGKMYVLSSKDVSTAIAALKKSYKLINYCVNNNIRTGWHAPIEEE